MAERYAMEAVEISSGTGWEASALVIYGQALAERGDLDAADAAAARALRIALRAGLENWFRMALRHLAGTAALRARLEDATLLVGASRCNMPSWGLDPAIYGPLEEQCRDGLGADRFAALAGQGAALAHAQLLDLVDARTGDGIASQRPTGSGRS